MAGLKYWVWLAEVKGLTNRSKLLLLDHFGTPENVYYADEDEYTLFPASSCARPRCSRKNRRSRPTASSARARAWGCGC